MDADLFDNRLARVAGAIAEPARSRMLCCLMDGHARTSTELAVVAQVSPSTASVHLARLKEQRLVELVAQGKYRYYRLATPEVGIALESLLVVAGSPPTAFVPTTPHPLRHARTCYDHMAGALAVALHDHLKAQNWIVNVPQSGDYGLTLDGEREMANLGVEVAPLRKLRRRFACGCLDWSERRPHLGGALGAAMLKVTLANGWVEQELDSRALQVTREGRRQFERRFGYQA
jgi:DNA-binding transcriptional ArsR family regulator